MTEETVTLYSSVTGIEFRRFNCSVLYFNAFDYVTEGLFNKFRETTEIYFPESSIEALTGNETMLINVNRENLDSKLYFMPSLGAGNFPEFFLFIDGSLVVPEDMKDTYPYTAIFIMNEAIEDKNDGGIWNISLPAEPLDTGMTIDEVCAFFDGMNKAVQEYAALID